MDITINDATQALEAASWCKSNNIKYKLEYWGWPSNTRYKFIFDRNRDLVLFSLKWA